MRAPSVRDIKTFIMDHQALPTVLPLRRAIEDQPVLPRSMRPANNALAEPLHLKLANVASPLALRNFTAHHLATSLLHRVAIVPAIASTRGLRWSCQCNEREHQYDRPHIIS
jgi:hypothetical protein